MEKPTQHRHIYIYSYIYRDICAYTLMLAFIPHTDESIRRMLVKLNAQRALLDPNAFALKQQMYGFTWSKYSLITHERIRLNLISCHMWDWAHLLCCDGLADVEVGLFFKRLQQARSTSNMYEFATFTKSFTLPRCYTSLDYILSPDRIKNNLKKSSFSSSASELLTLLPMLQRYTTHTVLGRQECEQECRSLLAVLDYLECIASMKSGRNCIDAPTLLSKIVHHLNLFKECYGEETMRPKHHYSMHLPACLQRHGCLLSTLVNERRHKVVKKFTRDRQSLTRWELGALEEVVMQQMHEASEDWYTKGITHAHPAGGIILNTLKQVWPSVNEFNVANHARGQCGRVMCRDIVWCDTSRLGDSSGYWCAQLHLCFTAMGAELCIVSPTEVASNSSSAEWPAFKIVQEAVVIPIDCIIVAAHYKASDTAIAAHRPMFLR